MAQKVPSPIKITDNFFQLGTMSFPVYLSIGVDAALIEGGTGPTAKIISEQVKMLGIDPMRIKYIVLTHTHADHIGAIPHLKLSWPHIKVIVSEPGAKILSGLKNEKALAEFKWVDSNISSLMLSKGDINEMPPLLDEYDFSYDEAVQEGYQLDLGNGIVWTAHSTPGHSVCHMAWFEEKEKTLVIGDTTGFYVPSLDIFWPNYFHSLKDYVASIKMLSSLPAQRGVLSHNCLIESPLQDYFEKALKATETYHNEMIERINSGEDPEELAIEKAKWVNTLTDIQPYKVMLNLTRLLITRSLKEEQDKDIF